MGCWSGKEGEVQRPRESQEAGGRRRSNNNNNRPNYARNERAAPSDPYWGTIDKIENVIQDSYVGEGIKRTHAYTTDLTEDQYKKWKEQFWETRCEGSEQVWTILKRWWEVDHEEAEALIKENNIILHNNRLTFCYDQKGRSYVVPAACINEPVDFGEDKEKEQLKKVEEPEDYKTLNLTLRNASTFEDDKITIDESWSVKELKEQYAELKDWDNCKKVRILYYGRELHDDYKLWHYGINDDIILIGVINNILFEEE